MALTENVYSKYSKLMNNPPSPVHGVRSVSHAHSQWLQWVDQQPATTEALPALGTGHDGTFFCCSDHCV